MAMKELLIKDICGNTASHMIDYWGLEIDSDSWICVVKRNSHIFLHTGTEVLNLNYKIILTKSSAHIPWILCKKTRATNTSSQRPKLSELHAGVLWVETSWARDSIVFLISSVTQQKYILEIWFSALRYLAACGLLNTAV